MNNFQKQIIKHVAVSIDLDTVINEEWILNEIEKFSRLYPVSELEKNEVIGLLHTRFAIRMDRGACVKEKNHLSWYYSAKKDLSGDFWDRYRSFLLKDKEFAPDVVNALDASTDEMMDLLGNPLFSLDFQRRGLVIGDIQSGKTATYTALINKAADAGYRIVILLTGTMEKLRKQTQSRLDEGFIGLDSNAFIRDKSKVVVGVGNYNPNISGWAVTSTTSDFNKSTAQKLSGQLSSISAPVLFVIKKNKSVLEKLEQWLKLYNANQITQTCPLPMLLVDDEADNASVNTKTSEDPTAINTCIRKLLKLFSKANYIGFTATPFANIFIDPDSNQEMLDDDLFPRDFIYALEAPSNYVGARSIFSDDGPYSFMLKNNDDCEKYLPESHKKEFVPQGLPTSLKEAIVSFFIANTVRDLKGDLASHRSMLINISRFIDVQEHIGKSVDAYVREFQLEIKNYHLTGQAALKHESFSFIKSVYENHFRNITNFEFNWDEIQKNLHKAVASIEVHTMNGRNASESLNYDEYDEGLRLIAIGGFVLSRGLTLEGLCVSYFYRNSKMYDTLMQMGRWFGYRDGYEEVCQIWMSENAIGWYKYVSVASDELRREVIRMKEQNKTPKDFGLSVKSDIVTLLVTAKNKMKTAVDYEMTVSLSGKMVETPYLYIDKEVVKSNLRNTESWINSLSKEGYPFCANNNLALKNPQLKNIPKKNICEYLSSYKSHSLNMDFHSDELVSLIESINDGTLDKWDVILATGKGEPLNFCGQNIRYVQRKFDIKKLFGALRMSRGNSRLGDKNNAKGGLTIQEVNEIEKLEVEYQIKTGRRHEFSEDLYFKSGHKRNPLLVIYPVELKIEVDKKTNDNESEIEELTRVVNSLPKPIIGLSIGIPKINGKEDVKLNYKINKIKSNELFEGKLSENEDFEEETGESDYQTGGIINGQ